MYRDRRCRRWSSIALSSLIRICTICYLATNIIRKSILIIMFKLKKKKDKYLYSVIALGLHIIIQYYHSYFGRTAHEIFISVFFFFFTFNLFTFHSGHLVTINLSSIKVIQFRWYITFCLLQIIMCNIATVFIVWISIRWFIICLLSASIYTPVIYDSLNSIAA